MLNFYCKVIVGLWLSMGMTVFLAGQQEELAVLDSLAERIESAPDEDSRLTTRIKAIERAQDIRVSWAWEQINIAIGEARKLDREKDVIWLLSLASEAQLIMGEYKQADSLVDVALKVCPDSSAVCPPDVIARLYNLRGNANFQINDFVTAGKAFQQTGEWYLRSGAPERAITARFNAGSIYLQTGATGRAIQVFTDLIDEVKDSMQLAYIYNNLGICYTSKKDLEKSLDYYQRAAGISEVSPDLKQQIQYNLALNYEDLERYEQAVGMYEELLPQFERSQNVRLTARTYLGLGKSYSRLNRLELGRNYIEKAEKMISAESQPTEYIDLLKVKHEVNSSLGNYAEAYRALLDLRALRDTLALNEQRQQFVELQEKYESDKKEAENQALKMREELNLATIQKQRLGLIGSIVAIVLALGILAVFWRQNRIKTRYNRHLEEKNKSIDLLHRELKHRVHNNLSFILSMLRLQKDKVSDKKMQQQLQENVDRVQAISMVYSKLDTKSDEVEVDLKDYLSELIEALLFSVTEQKKTPASSLNISPITQDPQTAMEMGIILNELVTNSLKYAFTAVDEPRIVVHLREDGEGRLHFEYTDNGPGFSPHKDGPHSEGFGLSLVESLVDTLKGQVSYSQNGQMKVTIQLPQQNV